MRLLWRWLIRPRLVRVADSIEREILWWEPLPPGTVGATKREFVDKVREFVVEQDRRLG